MLGAVLLLGVVLALVLGALLLRTDTAHRAVRHQEDRARARYEAMGALDETLRRVSRGTDPSAAAAQVSAETGKAVRHAGGRLLVDSGSGGAVQARLEPLAFRHVLFGSTLDLDGANGAFDPEDAHGPATGAPPSPTAEFLDAWREVAVASGIHLASDPAESTFRPGGGAWREELADGKPSFLYLGGGAGDDLGWIPGVHRWTLTTSSRWTCSTGESLTHGGDGWTWRAPGASVLAGVVLVEQESLTVSDGLELLGTLIVWQGSLDVRRGTLAVHPGADSTLAVAALGGGDAPEPWNEDRVARAGDVLLTTGAGQLAVGDPGLPEETGSLVLAQNRLVKNGARLAVAGVVAGGLLEIHGVAAGDYTWSGRVGRLPPAHLAGGSGALVGGAAVQVR